MVRDSAPAARATGDAAIGLELRADAMTRTVPTPIGEDAHAATTAYLVSAAARCIRRRAARLGDRFVAAEHALVHLRALVGDPTCSGDAVDGGVGYLRHTLAHARRSLRALGAELAELEAEGRRVVAAAFDARARRRLADEVSDGP